MIFDVSHPEVQSVIEHALAEDIGTGDVTSRLCVDADITKKPVEQRLHAKTFELSLERKCGRQIVVIAEPNSLEFRL